MSPRARAKLEHLVVDGEQAKRELTQANSRLVISMAKRYLGQVPGWIWRFLTWIFYRRWRRQTA